MRRAILTLIAVAVFGLYIVQNHLMNGQAGLSLETPLDRAIPFWPPAEVVYVTIYLFFFMPVLEVRDMKVFERVAHAFYAQFVFCMAIYWLFPVRVDRPTGFPLDSFFSWGVALIQACDPPHNCFPSLHVSNAVFVGLIAYRLDRPVGIAALVLAAAIAVSTLLVKQHWVADVLTGALLGYALYRLFVAPAVPPGAPRETLVFPRRYLLVLPALHLVAVVALATGYGLGWQPFAWPQAPGPRAAAGL